jgi:hypothetical protein
MRDTDIINTKNLAKRASHIASKRLKEENKPKIQIKCECGNHMTKTIPKNWSRQYTCPFCNWEFSFQIRRVP